MVEQRDGYHEKWDLEKDATMIEFYEAYPEYKNYPVPEDEFSWIWYYAMQHMGDLAAKETTLVMRQKILKRYTISEKIALFVPTMHAQLSFNHLANTDLLSYFNFLKTLTKFHERLRLEFYPKIFNNAPANKINWKNYQTKFYSSNHPFNWVWEIVPTGIITLVIGILGHMNLRKL